MASRLFKYYLRKVALWLGGAITMTILYYLAFSMLFNTDMEEMLSRENDAYEQEYAILREKEKMLIDEVNYLQLRDDGIYRQIFHSEAPRVDPSGILVSDSTSVADDNAYLSLVMESLGRLDSLSSRTSSIEDNFREIFALAAKDTVPPMGLPVKTLSYVVTGASVGIKYNPFYKVDSKHEGLDIIAAQGTPVYATADGEVISVVTSTKGKGNTVTIDHNNGYYTVYSHLSTIKVRKRQKVVKGEEIAEVGVSGKSYAPHLHYEVHKGDELLDPVHYMFAGLSPEEYTGVAYISAHTGQSLD